MTDQIDLDDVEAIRRADPSDMLGAVLTAGDQIREGLQAWSQAASLVDALEPQRRPRQIVLAGMGGSAMAGDMVRAIASRSTIPIVPVRGYHLPSSVGASDLVIAVSCSGATEETLSIADHAQRRGARWLAVAADPSPLAERARDAGVPVIGVDGGGRAPRANLWALTVPALGVAEAFGAGSLLGECAATADAVDAESARSGPPIGGPNPAKQLARELVGTLPLIWGTTPFMAVAAYRFMAQLAENADQPAVHGELPEANHNQVVALAGTSPTARAMAMVLLRDHEEHPQVTKRAAVSAQIARGHGLPVIEVSADGGSALQRFATVVQRIDLASVYLSLLIGIDPSDIAPITLLKQEIAK